MTPEEIRDLYNREDGDDCSPEIPAQEHRTEAGTRYLREAGVGLVSRPDTDMYGAYSFFEQMAPDTDYLDDEYLTGGAKLAKFAGQLCYLSLGKERTRNGDASRYFENIKRQSHGSVLEHANYSVLLYGVSRALTHELVRHRSGMAYSQVSQRYVPPRHVRFVEAYEYQGDLQAHYDFESWIDSSVTEYERREQAALLREFPHRFEEGVCAQCGKEADASAGRGTLYFHLPCEYRKPTTEDRKRVRQAARRCLPNETEAPILATGNIRAWRHIIEMRCSPHADVEIRRAFWRVFLVLAIAEPLLWEDYTARQLDDGTYALDTPYRKV